MPHLSITTNYLQIRTKKILLIKKFCHMLNVETNIAKTFLKRIDKYLPKTNKFHKIFNRNIVRVSDSFLPNFSNMTKSCNSKILSEETAQDQPKCNC